MPSRVALDFWIGTWDVHNAKGQLAAKSVIEPLANAAACSSATSGAGPSGGR